MKTKKMKDKRMIKPRTNVELRMIKIKKEKKIKTIKADTSIRINMYFIMFAFL